MAQYTPEEYIGWKTGRLAAREKGIDKRQHDLDVREARLAKALQSVKVERSEIEAQAHAQAMIIADQKIVSMRADLDPQSTLNKNRAIELVKRETALVEKIKQFALREAEVAEREKMLDEQERRIGEARESIERRERAIRFRQQGVEASKAALKEKMLAAEAPEFAKTATEDRRGMLMALCVLSKFGGSVTGASAEHRIHISAWQMNQCISELMAAGLVGEVRAHVGSRRVVLTEKGRVWLEAVQAVPFPVAGGWRIP